MDSIIFRKCIPLLTFGNRHFGATQKDYMFYFLQSFGSAFHFMGCELFWCCTLRHKATDSIRVWVGTTYLPYNFMVGTRFWYMPCRCPKGFWLIGQKKAVMLGGALLCCGHLILAFDALWAFYSGQVLIVLGVGALKPNISTMVGGLYRQGDARRDTAFTIFYVGINIGAFCAPLIVGYVGEVINWHYGFGLAGIGMAIGQLVYIYGQRHLKGIGEFVSVKKGSKTHERKEKQKFTKVEKDRMIVLLLSFVIVIVFWGAYEQAGGLMNLYAKEKIDRLM